MGFLGRQPIRLCRLKESKEFPEMDILLSLIRYSPISFCSYINFAFPLSPLNLEARFLVSRLGMTDFVLDDRGSGSHQAFARDFA